ELYYDKTAQLRAGNVWFMPLEWHEILYRLKECHVDGERLIGSKELINLRDYYETCLSRIDILQLAPNNEDRIAPEARFVHQYESAVWWTLLLLGLDVRTDKTAQVYCNWIMDNLLIRLPDI